MNPTAEQLRAAGWVEKSPGQWVKDSLIQENGVWTIRNRYSIEDLRAIIKERGIDNLVAMGWKREDLENLGAGKDYSNPQASNTNSYGNQAGVSAPRLTGECQKSNGREISAPPARTVKRLRQSSKPLLDKTEARWKMILMARGIVNIMEQAITLRLDPPFKSYRADLAYLGASGLVLVEVKGPHRFREKGIAKAALAAKTYPQFRFELADWTGIVWKESVLSA